MHASRTAEPMMTTTIREEFTVKDGSDSEGDYNELFQNFDESNLQYVIPDDVKNRVIDIPNDFRGHDKNNFELTEDEVEMVQSVLISNDEIKARCAEMAK